MGDHGAGQLSPLFQRRAIRWDAKAGVYRVDLEDGHRTILRELMQQMIDLLADPGAPVLQRLFPPAYSQPGHVAHQDEYRRLMQDDLVERRREECRLVMNLAGAATLTEEQLLSWSRAINSVRLALGTYLDVTEDQSPSMDTAEESAYHWLSYLLQESIDAMSRQT